MIQNDTAVLILAFRSLGIPGHDDTCIVYSLGELQRRVCRQVVSCNGVAQDIGCHHPFQIAGTLQEIVPERDLQHD